MINATPVLHYATRLTVSPKPKIDYVDKLVQEHIGSTTERQANYYVTAKDASEQAELEPIGKKPGVLRLKEYRVVFSQFLLHSSRNLPVYATLSTAFSRQSPGRITTVVNLGNGFFGSTPQQTTPSYSMDAVNDTSAAYLRIGQAIGEALTAQLRTDATGIKTRPSRTIRELGHTSALMVSHTDPMFRALMVGSRLEGLDLEGIVEHDREGILSGQFELVNPPTKAFAVPFKPKNGTILDISLPQQGSIRTAHDDLTIVAIEKRSGRDVYIVGVGYEPAIETHVARVVTVIVDDEILGRNVQKTATNRETRRDPRLAQAAANRIVNMVTGEVHPDFR